MLMQIKNSLLISVMLILLVGCVRHSKMRIRNLLVTSLSSDSVDLCEVHDQPIVTVWVHGTRFIPQRIFLHEFNEKPGLKRSIDINPYYYLNQIAHLLHKKASSRFPLETFYVFCWDGKLSHYFRLKASQVLYHMLKDLISEYKERYGQTPKIQLICHSHGGNVALNLAFFEQIEHAGIEIERLILMACPVQTNTMNYVSHSIFKRVYSLASSFDFIQIMAPQNFNETLPFSERYFPRFPNLIQANIKLNGHAVSHTEFSSRRFLLSLPLVMDFLDDLDIQAYNDSTKKLFIHIRNRQRVPKNLFLTV
jgi:hypothetical protein